MAKYDIIPNDMVTITITKKEYEKLVDAKLRFEYVRHVLADNIFSAPPVKSVHSVIKNFRATKRYNKAFLRSLEQGLKRSDYFSS